MKSGVTTRSGVLRLNFDMDTFSHLLHITIVFGFRSLYFGLCRSDLATELRCCAEDRSLIDVLGFGDNQVKNLNEHFDCS